MSDNDLNNIAKRLAYEFYHDIMRRNNAFKLNSEQMDCDASEMASENKHLFLRFAKMKQDIKCLLTNIDEMIKEDDTNLDDEDLAMISQIRADYKE